MKFEEPYTQYKGKFFQSAHQPGKKMMAVCLYEIQPGADHANAIMIWDVDSISATNVSLTQFFFEAESRSEQPWLDVEFLGSYPKRMIKGLFKA
jgi:hypothetical protein